MRFLRLPLIACLIFIYASCKKDTADDLIPSFYFLNGGTSSFNNSLILFNSSDTINFNLIVSSTYLLSGNTNVTLGIVDDSLTTYNSENSTSYELMPANAYNFQTQYTANDSLIYDTVEVTIYKHALDLSKSYMLPIGIIDAGGIGITTGASVIYLHTTNSVLSGIYNSTGIKTSYNGDAAGGSVNSIDTFSLTKSLIPVTETESDIDYADLGSNGWKYRLYYYISNGTPVFTINPNSVIIESVQSNSFQILSSSYDPETHEIDIKSSYKNTSGNERIVEESLKLQ